MLYEKATPHALGYRDVTPDDVHASAGKCRLVDVREPHEYTGELGHIDGAELVPLATVEAAASAWDKKEELVLVCRSGNRSGKAAAALLALGFEKPMNMVGGMLAWNEHGLPVAK